MSLSTIIGILVALKLHNLFLHDMTVLHQYQTWHTDHSVTGLHEINNVVDGKYPVLAPTSIIFSYKCFQYKCFPWLFHHQHWCPCCSETTLHMTFLHQHKTWYMTHNPLCDWTSWNKQLMLVSMIKFLRIYLSL